MLTAVGAGIGFSLFLDFFSSPARQNINKQASAFFKPEKLIFYLIMRVLHVSFNHIYVQHI